MNPETKIQNLIRLELAKHGYSFWRNEVGSYWTGRVIHRTSNQVTLDNAAMLPVGLCVGSSDLIGIGPNGLFAAIEVKTKTGRPSTEQVEFIDRVRARGGIAGIARSPQEAIELLNAGV